MKRANNWPVKYGNTLDSFTFKTYLHEVGHALGLGHPGPYNTSVLSLAKKVFLNDSYHTTVMSYFDPTSDTFISASSAHPVTPMMADIVAIQNLYGAPSDTHSGDTVYGYQSNIDGYLAQFFTQWVGETDTPFETPVALTLYDNDGNDTLDLRTDTTDQQVDLRPEGISDVYGLVGNLTIARDTLIENFTAGSGNDHITGNAVANRLNGGEGDDEIWGGDGDDELTGNGGTDWLNGGAGADILLFEFWLGDTTIADFTDNQDRIDLTYFELSGIDELVITSDTDGVTIDMSSIEGGGTILLEGFDIANLDAADFIF